MGANLVTIPAERAFEVIALNKQGEKPLTLKEEGENKRREKGAFGDILGEDDLTRFDRKKKKKKKKPTSAPAGDSPGTSGEERPAPQRTEGDRPKKKRRKPSQNQDPNKNSEPNPPVKD